MGLLVLALMALAICNTPVLGVAKAASIQDQQDYLTAHNQARAAVGVGPLKWSTGLFNVATRLVKSSTKNCTVANGPEANNYGVNQFRLLAEHNWLPQGVVSRWAEMKKYYNYMKNECVPQGQPCRTYTQVVWRNTLELGRAQAMCDKGAGYLTICLYNPSGNIEGQRPTNFVFFKLQNKV